MRPTPPILERGLTPPEKAKFDRVRNPLAAAASAAGRVIQVCEATGDGLHRRIVLGRGILALPLFAVSAAQFLEAEEGDLVSEFQRMLTA